MADTIKILAQSNPDATTDTDIYTVPTNTSTVVSSITICEIGGGTPSFRIALKPKGAVISNEHYMFFDKALAANQSIIATGGFTLAQGDVIMVRASDGNVAFTVHGVETTKEEQ